MVSVVLKGYARKMATKPDSRLPITPDIMRVIKQNIRYFDSSSHNQLVLWSAFALMFFSFLRVSELLNLNSCDVAVFDSVIEVHIKQSKTDQLCRGEKITVRATNNSICPVRAVRKLLESHIANLIPLSAPLLSLFGGSVLNRAHIVRALRFCLASLPDSSLYNTHSFRIGAATTAAANGASPDAIKAAGRWKSSAYFGYIRQPRTAPRLC